MLAKTKPNDSFVWEEFIKIARFEELAFTKKELMITTGKAKKEDFSLVIEDFANERRRINDFIHDLYVKKANSVMTADWHCNKFH